MQPWHIAAVLGIEIKSVMAQRKLDMHQELVAKLRQHDRGAQFEAYQLYSTAMYNTALRIVQSEADAEDALQEAFLAAFTKIEQYLGDSTFGAWLKRIVVNKCLNVLQARKASFVPLEDAPLAQMEYQGSEDASPLWNVDQVMRAVNALPDGYRVVFSLYLLEGYDHREIAEILGITEGGSKSQFNRAKQKVREILTVQSYV